MSICVVNVIPLYGVQVLGWSAFFIIFTYWLENFVIGFYTILKMRRHGGKLGIHQNSILETGGVPDREWSNFFTIVFFIIHFGGFILVHGVFIFTLFHQSGELLPLPALLMFVSLMISHGVSYFVNFVGKEEFKIVTLNQLLRSPYARIVPLHLTIVLAAYFFILGQSNPSIYALTLLVIMKLGLDLILHIFERFRFEGSCIR